MQGHNLVIALSRTAGKKAKAASKRVVEVTDRHGLVSRMSPSECIHLVCDSAPECYIGTGSMHRIRSIEYRAPVPCPVSIADSGFSGFNRYPLPDQSTIQVARAA